jgi:hypothetical protein
MLTAARSDLRAAGLLAADDQQTGDVIGFHAQQAVEKAIKAVLVSSDIAIPYTYDLGFCLTSSPSTPSPFRLHWLTLTGSLRGPSLHATGPRMPRSIARRRKSSPTTLLHWQKRRLIRRPAKADPASRSSQGPRGGRCRCGVAVGSLRICPSPRRWSGTLRRFCRASSTRTTDDAPSGRPSGELPQQFLRDQFLLDPPPRRKHHVRERRVPARFRR